MQRFYSTFPNERPGAGLFLLRLTLASALVGDAISGLQGAPLLQAFAGAEILTGALIVVGLWTPIAAVLVCLIQFGMLVTVDRIIEFRILCSAAALSLALLGPGAWSIDARLFGRKRVEIKHLRDE